MSDQNFWKNPPRGHYLNLGRWSPSCHGNFRMLWIPGPWMSICKAADLKWDGEKWGRERGGKNGHIGSRAGRMAIPKPLGAQMITGRVADPAWVCRSWSLSFWAFPIILYCPPFFHIVMEMFSLFHCTLRICNLFLFYRRLQFRDCLESEERLWLLKLPKSLKSCRKFWNWVVFCTMKQIQDFEVKG